MWWQWCVVAMVCGNPGLDDSTILILQATHIALRSIVQDDKRRIPEEEKANRVADVLQLILPSNSMLHMVFPIHRLATPTSTVQITHTHSTTLSHTH